MEPLRALSADRWRSLDAAARAVAQDAMLTQLPPDFCPATAPAQRAWPRFRHLPTGLDFIVVFGRALTMGGAPPLEDWQPWMRSWPLVDCATVQPARVAAVRTFLLADDFVPPDVWRQWGVPLSGAHGLAVPPGAVPQVVPALARVALRLPSEAEWELAGEHDAVSGMGAFEELCADDWHDGYDGAPSDGRPFGAGAQVLRSKLGPSQVRRRLTDSSAPVVRPAFDAPW